MANHSVDDVAAPLLAKAERLAREVAAPNAAKVNSEARFPAESLKALAAEGFLGLCVPTAQGGLGEGPRTFAAVVEALAQACCSSAVVYVMHMLGEPGQSRRRPSAGGSSCWRRSPRATPHHPRLLGEGLALAVLGAGVQAQRAAPAPSPPRPSSRGSPPRAGQLLRLQRPRARARPRRLNRRSTWSARDSAGAAWSAAFNGLGLAAIVTGPMSWRTSPGETAGIW